MLMHVQLPRLSGLPRLVRGSGWILFGAILFSLSSACGESEQASSGRRATALVTGWELHKGQSTSNAWSAVAVPGAWEEVAGTQFDGVGWYRTRFLTPPYSPGERVFLYFDAVATEAEVWCNEQRMGSHLGGWTPFRFDVTSVLAGVGKTNELRVRVDEKVGHNTQGFLPIVQPHFGGIWQPVTLLVLPEAGIDDLRLAAWGNPLTSELEVEVPFRGNPSKPSVRLAWRPTGSRKWSSTRLASVEGTLQPARDGVWRASVEVQNPRRWSPETPHLYEVKVHMEGNPSDEVNTRAAFRTVETRGRQLLVNGLPVQLRGVLNWGYYPPRLAPNPSEERMRSDLRFARERGFNLMKFCLWVPPKRFLELADEAGMMVWAEYPTWHPQLTQEHLPALAREFDEFFHFDRMHPAVVLRSLTCETGSSADLNVLRSLYERAHQLIPWAVVEDDSSWIEWNRVSDIYDDHPYGNNHTWVETLSRLRQFVSTNQAKPLVLGEAIAADTWVPRNLPLATDPSLKERPYWFPKGYEAQGRWMEEMAALVGRDSVDRLHSDSLSYAMLMRKYQAETFRREIPEGGYVISVIRDFPLASMGLLDYQHRPKWTVQDWSWQRDTLSILETTNDCRSFVAGGHLQAAIWVSHFGARDLEQARLEVVVRRSILDKGVIAKTNSMRLSYRKGETRRAFSFDLTLPASSGLQKIVLSARLASGSLRVTNSWPLWLVPPVGEIAPLKVDKSVSTESKAALGVLGAPAWAEAGEGVVLASQFSDQLLSFLEQGGNVLMLPDGGERSLPVKDHWFLRGAPVRGRHPLGGGRVSDLLVELQHFDLAGGVIPGLRYVRETTPLLMLWDTHDLAEVRTHGLVYETRVGKGRLLVSALRHGGAENAAGRWLFSRMVDHLAQPAQFDLAELSSAKLARLKEQAHAQSINLTQAPWRFRPDPEPAGLAKGWHLPSTGTPDPDWTDIRAGEHWDSQGYGKLDGWAWYRREIEVPTSWAGRNVYLSFEGVDDAYELYVNGHLAGKGGDIEKRQTAFEARTSHPVTAWVQPGTRATLAVRVYDWYGAGGIFRPVTLGTAELPSEDDLLR